MLNFRKMLFNLMIVLGFSVLKLNIVFADEIIVSAAASLTDVFRELAAEYQNKYPDGKIALNFAGSGSLLQQIDNGAPVDVFAAADQTTMDIAQNKELLANKTRVNFARNTLVLIVPIDSNVIESSLSALLKSPTIKKIAVGNPASVPVGRYTKLALEDANLWSTIENKIIYTNNVRQALNYVATVSVDAAFVYGTDVRIMADKVKMVFEVPLNEPIIYPIAQVKASKNSIEATRFIEFIKSAESQEILLRYGFSMP